tara:strand:- start:15 stop:449 length:435 start_codon:yes stop_codon:yes gene_type:complete
MSKKEESLMDRFVTLYIDGGWEVSGKVKSMTDNKIVLEEQGSDDLFLVFRDKISCLRIVASTAGLRPDKSVYSKVETKSYEDFPMNKIAYDDSGMTIPQGLLKDAPDASDDDFSVSFGSEKESENASGNGGIEFRLYDDTKKED